MKRTRMALWLFLCILVFSQGIYPGKAEAADSKVEITISGNRVANLFYQVTMNDKPIMEDVTYEIEDWSGKIIYKGDTDQSFIRLEQVPYGKYKIIIITKEGKKYEFPIDVNTEYVKTQHEIKYLNLEEIKRVNTGDENNWKNYVGLLMISAGMVIYMCFQNLLSSLTGIPQKRKSKMRSITGFLAAVLMILFIEPYLWAEAADIEVDIAVEAANMDITVPSTLPIMFNADGSNTFPENFKITNNSKTTGIFLVKAEMNANGSGWRLLSEQTDVKKMPADIKDIKIYMGKADDLKLVKPADGSVSEKGSCTFGSADIVIGAEQSQTLSFGVERGMFTSNLASGKAFDLVLAFDWVKEPVLTTGMEFYSTIPTGTTQILFTDETPPDGISLTDVSEVKNKSVVSWSDGTTYYVSSQVKGSKVIANEDCEGMFGNEEESNSWSVECIDVVCLDTSNVTNMNDMFCCAGKEAGLFQINGLSEWNTSSVNRMIGMFKNAGYFAVTFQIGDLSSWDTSNVKYMTSMFEGAGYHTRTFDIGDLSSWNTSNTGYMSSMFKNAAYQARAFSIGNLENWDTINVNEMSNMFENAGYNARWSLDCSKWDVSRARNSVDFNKGVEEKVTKPRRLRN